MALSNWATLAFDDAGQPCRGVLTGFDGGETAIYKNWLYVRDPKMWTAGRYFEAPTIAQITEGDVTISEFGIKAIRHAEQEAIFAFVQCRQASEVRCMAGIGCNGFTDPTLLMAEAAGVKIDDWDSVSRGVEYSESGERHLLHCYAEDTLEIFEVPWSDQFEARWIGVTAELQWAFFNWLDKLVMETEYAGPTAEWLMRCRAHGGLQFNQGDMFFAEHGIGDPTEIMTPIGSPRTPMLMQMLRE